MYAPLLVHSRIEALDAFDAMTGGLQSHFGKEQFARLQAAMDGLEYKTALTLLQVCTSSAPGRPATPEPLASHCCGRAIEYARIHFMTLLCRSVLVLVSSWVAIEAGAASAQEPELPPVAATFRPHWEVGIAAQLMYGIEGARCTRVASDVVGCSELAMFTFEFAPRYRFRDFSLGAVTQLGKGDSVSLLRLGAEARYQPVDTVDVEPWLGADAGAAVLIDALPTDELGPAKSFVTVAPALGISLGVDFALGETVSLGISTRLLWLALGARDSEFERKPSYDDQVVLSGGIVGTYRFEP